MLTGLALPFAHAGGELVVKHRDDQHVFHFDRDLAPKHSFKDTDYFVEDVESAVQKCNVSCGLTKAGISYAAFFGDVLHEIRPVRAGYRLTLSYNLHRAAEVDEGSEVVGKKRQREASSGKMSADDDEDGGDSDDTVDSTEGYPPTASTDFSKLRVPGLKFLMAFYGLPGQSGTKAKMVQALQQGATLRSSEQPVQVPDLTLVLPMHKLDPNEAALKTDQLMKTLHAALTNKCFFAFGGLLGVPCFHLYETEHDLPDERDLSKHATLNELGKLRGVDALLALGAARLGIKVHILRLQYSCDACVFLTNVCCHRLLETENKYAIQGMNTIRSVKELPSLNVANRLGGPEIIDDDSVGFGVAEDNLKALPRGKYRVWPGIVCFLFC